MDKKLGSLDKDKDKDKDKSATAALAEDAAGTDTTAPAEPTTTVGPTITIRGKLKTGEDLVIKGRIDAEITSSKALFIENSGVVRANMNVASARISGVLLGDVTAESKIEIASDGRMIGDMLAPRIVIQDGAAFRGSIDMPNFTPKTAVGSTPSGPSTRASSGGSSAGARTAGASSASATSTTSSGAGSSTTSSTTATSATVSGELRPRPTGGASTAGGSKQDPPGSGSSGL